MTRASPAAAATLLGAALLAVALAAAAVPVAAHGNHASVDPQVSSNGTVVVETAYASTDGWLVLHRDDGGSPGEPVGHARLSAGTLHTDVTVAADGAAWRRWSNGTAWVVLHRDQGGDGFDPAEDPALRSFGSLAGQQFTLARGERAAVTAAGFSPQRSEGNVTVRRAALPSDGHVVVHNGSVDGDVVGSASLPAGTHRNVTVPLDDAFFRSRDRATLVAALYADDGNGRFDDADRRVRAGDAPVTTTLFAYLGADGGGESGGSLVTTATPGGDGPGADGAGTPTDGGGPGPGAGAALLALVLGLLARARR